VKNRIRSTLDVTLQAIVLVLMTALAVLVVVGVAFRKLGAALVWYDEVAAILLAWLTYYGAGLAALRGAHIGFPKLVSGAPPAWKQALEVVRLVIVVAFFGLTAWAGWRVLRVVAGTSLVSVPWIPVSLTQSVIPIAAVLFITAELVTFRTPPPPEPNDAGDP
jgi:TRAP-type C4-dicarboxylate transport system permease small subunit